MLLLYKQELRKNSDMIKESDTVLKNVLEMTTCLKMIAKE